VEFRAKGLISEIRREIVWGVDFSV